MYARTQVHGRAAHGGCDEEYAEPDHDRDLRWSINNHDGKDLDAGAFKVVPANEMPESASADAVGRIARSLGKKVTYLEPGNDEANLFDGVTNPDHPDQVYKGVETAGLVPA